MAGAVSIFMKFKERFGKKSSNTPETAASRFAATMDCLNLLAYPTGIELTDNWQMSYRGLGGVLVNLWMLWWEFYSLYELLPGILGVVTSAGFIFQITIITKFVAIWSNHRKYYSLIQFLSKVYKSNTSGPRDLILSETTKTIWLHFKIVFAGMVTGFLLYAFYPCYDLIVNGNLTKVSPMVLPGLDDTVLRGYVISFVLNVSPVSYEFFGVFAVSCMFLTYVDGYAGMVDLVETDFKLLDGMWKTPNQDITERKLAFRNLMMKLMDLYRYNHHMNNLFNDVATVQIGACYSATIIVLFAYLATNYISGLGAAAYFMSELMTICYMGQLMENTTERLEEIIYNADWYTYETKYQLDILFALSIIQGVKPVLVFGISPLNFETGLKVVNSIYSMTMFFIGVLD